MSGRTVRENIFPSRIQGNVSLSLSDGLFPRIYFHGNIFHFHIHETFVDHPYPVCTETCSS
jgi:hypothetical protein